MERKKSLLRKASIEDASILFTWKNDKATIQNSLSGRGVTWEEHIQWLQQVLKDKKRPLYIMEVGGQPAGQLRLDIEGEQAEISYSIAEEYRGQGYGKELLMQAEMAARQLEINLLTAEVLSHNLPSQKLFLKLGYEEKREEKVFYYSKQNNKQQMVNRL